MDIKTINSKIEKLNENIQKEQNSISETKAKIKNYQAEIKILEEEKEKVYAEAFIRIMNEKGLESDTEKENFLDLIKESL